MVVGGNRKEGGGGREQGSGVQQLLRSYCSVYFMEGIPGVTHYSPLVPYRARGHHTLLKSPVFGDHNYAGLSTLVTKVT